MRIIHEMVARIRAPMNHPCHVSFIHENKTNIWLYNSSKHSVTNRIESCRIVAIGLFIICNKSNTEEDFRETFDKFGKIEEIYCVKDRSSGENKGIVYIKYSKTSEAAHALEEMNGKCLGVPSGARPLKVLVASR